MKIVELYKKKRTEFYVYILLGIILVILLGVVLFPSVFYEQWIWKYYWGPVVADAGNSGTASYNGVVAEEGYTMVSEITYGVILILAIYAIYKLLKKLNIVVDWRFALALLPYILFGPVSRVLEDTDYFQPPAVYWFISPLIYLQIAVYAISFLLLGYYLEKRYNSNKITVNKVVFVGGLIFLIPASIPIAQWILGTRWGSNIDAAVRFDVFLIVLSIVALTIILVYLFAHFIRKEQLKVYKNPLNLAMISGHLIDGLTSYISIKDPLAMGLFYSEKHPASNFLLEVWGPLFPIVKFILIILVIYFFDILYKKDLEKYSRLVNLLKIGILILGFSPGVRDLLRVTMGV